MIPLFIIDDSSIKEMLDGNETAVKVLAKFWELKTKHIDLKLHTPFSSLMRGIWLANPDSKIVNLQKLIVNLHVMPFIKDVDFKDEKAVREELIHFANFCDEVGRQK